MEIPLDILGFNPVQDPLSLGFLSIRCPFSRIFAQHITLLSSPNKLI
jgi:hypothetical protein